MTERELDIRPLDLACTPVGDAIDLASDQGQDTWLTDGGKRIARIVPADETTADERVIGAAESQATALTEQEEALADAEVDDARRLREEGRGRCQYCGGPYMLRKDGKVRRHPIRGTKAHCGGGERYPS